MPDAATKIETKPAHGLEVRPGLSVLIEPGGAPGTRFRTEFVGMVTQRYVAVRLPVQRKIIDVLHPNRPMTVRYLRDDGVICGFSTSLLHVMIKPFPILFMAFPRQVELASLRQHDRVSCFLPATVSKGPAPLAGMVTNISAGGLRVTLDTFSRAKTMEMKPGAEVSISLTLFNMTTETTLKGVIRGVTPEGERLALGIQFNRISREVQDNIQDYVKSVKEHLVRPEPL